MRPVAVYCSGSVPKGHSQQRAFFWGPKEREDLARAASPAQIVFFDPTDPLSTFDNLVAVLGRDVFQIEHSDYVVIDARERRGIGIGVELALGVHYSRPVVVVAPPGSYYRSADLPLRGTVVNDYVHPHLAGLSHTVVDTFAAAGGWIRDHQQARRDGPAHDLLSRASKAYVDHLLAGDAPTQAVLRALDAG
jgi:hypothetical protein